MSTPDRRLHARRGLRTRSCFNGHDVSPAQLCVLEIGAASIVVCGPACETEARARILRRIHDSPVAALQQALSDWQSGTGPPGVVLALLDLAAEEVMARASVLKLAQEAFYTARDHARCGTGDRSGGADPETEPSGTTNSPKSTLVEVALAVPDDPADNRSVAPGCRAR